MNERTSDVLFTLGERVKQVRLAADLTQNQVADIIGKSRTAIERAEKGKCTLDTFVSILVALGVDNQLDIFLPEPSPSPILLAKTQGKKRLRASGVDRKDQNAHNEDELGW